MPVTGMEAEASLKVPVMTGMNLCRIWLSSAKSNPQAFTLPIKIQRMKQSYQYFKESALKTASVSPKEEHQPTVVSNADGAKILLRLL